MATEVQGDTIRASAAVHMTEKWVKAQKATDERQEIRDALRKGLFLIVQPKSGAKSFQWRGRIDGKPTKKTLGRFPAMSLTEARDAVGEIQMARDKGEAAVIVFGAPEPEQGMTLTEAFELYMEREGDTRKTAQEKRRIFEKDVKPTLGDKAISAITEDDLADVIAAKLSVGATMSNRVHSELSRLFRWSITKGRRDTRLTVNPMANVVKMAEDRARKRYLSTRELKWFFKALPEASPQKRVKHARSSGDAYPAIYETLLRTITRSDDIHSLKWGELEGDKIVLSDSKNGEEQVIWLHPSVQRLIGKRKRGEDDELVFGHHKSTGAFNRLRKAMERLAEDEGATIEHWTLHDLRRTATTHMASIRDKNDHPKIPRNIRDMLLQHKDQSVMGVHYDKYEYYAEKKTALKIWNDWLNQNFLK